MKYIIEKYKKEQKIFVNLLIKINSNKDIRIQN